MGKKESNQNQTIENKTVKMSNYFFSLPRTSFIFIYILVLPLVLAFLNNLSPSYVKFSLLSIIELYFYILLIPTVLMIALAKLAKRSVRLRYLSSIAAISETIYGISLLLGCLFIHSFLIFLYIGVGLSIILWYIASRIMFSIKWRAILYAFLQSFLFLIFLTTPNLIGLNHLSTVSVSYNNYILLSILSFISVYLFVVILNAPAKRNFGLSVMDAVMSFVSHWLYNETDLEDVLDSLGQDCYTKINLLELNQLENNVHNESNSNIHRFFLVVPNIHYGPFGNLGSSAFPCKIQKLNDDKITYVALHGAATHDFNITTTKETNKFIRKVKELSDQLIHESETSAISNSRFKRSTLKYAQGKYNNAICDGFVFGKYAFISLSRHPKTTEDISFGAGLSLSNLGKSYGYDTIVVDEHNAETGIVDRFYPGDLEFYEYYNACIDFFNKIKHVKPVPFTLGYKHLNYENKYMGCAGINIFVLSSKYALIIFDSNGIDVSFKSKLEKSIKKAYGLTAIIYTTDTHSSNKVKGTLNPIQYDAELEKSVNEGVKDALEGSKPATINYISDWIKIRAPGPEQSTEIISTLNASFALLKILIPLFFILLIGFVLFFTLRL